ncbi:hypothetical protein BTR23_15325 [Alkalihalophilus pseudofirmus]|nr:hypothetical protein BTR23_15325 [Alkalihalophilus pseudofirmus]
MKKKAINWKVSFFVLASINGIIIITALISLFTLFQPRDNEESLLIDDFKPEAHFTIKTTRDELNQLLALKLNENPNQVVNYGVVLTDEQIEFETTIPVLSTNMGVQVTMVPEVAPNGDLLLHISTISMGQFQLPQHIVLQLLNDYLSFPPYVNVYSAEQIVHVIMSEIIEDENLSFYFERFDLLNNEIELRMKVH